MARITSDEGGAIVHGVSVYDSVEEAVAEHPEALVSVVFVPAAGAADAVYKAVDAVVRAVIVITEHIPVHDAIGFLFICAHEGQLRGGT